MMYSPELYNETNEITPKITKKCLDRFKEHIYWKPNESILEFGIGDGKSTKSSVYPVLPKDYKELILSDKSLSGLNYARNTLDFPRMEIVELDITTNNLKPEYENRFDHVLGFFVLHALKTNQTQAIKNVYKMLKPGGQTIMICCDHGPMDEATSKLAAHPKWKKYGDMTTGYFYCESPEKEYKRDLEEAGFKDFTFEVETDIVHDFGDDHTWKRLFVSCNEMVGNVPEEEKEEYINCFLEYSKNCKSLKFNEVNGKTTNKMMFSVKKFAASNGITPVINKKHLNLIKPHIKWQKNESILELGVGDGTSSQQCVYPFLPTDYKEYILSDKGLETINYAKQSTHIPKSKFIQLDITAMKTDAELENRFHHIFGLFLLHVLKNNTKQALKNIYKMLKPGGQVILNCFERSPMDDVCEEMNKHPKWGKYGNMNSEYYSSESPENEYRKSLEQIGFENIFTKTDRNLVHKFDDDTTWIKLYIAVNEMLYNVPDEEKEEYTNYYLDVCKRSKMLKFEEIDGKRIASLHFDIILIVATKPL